MILIIFPWSIIIVNIVQIFGNETFSIQIMCLKMLTMQKEIREIKNTLRATDD